MGSSLGEQLSHYIEGVTARGMNKTACLENAERNRKLFTKTIDDLPDITDIKPDGGAIVIGAGPSLHRKDFAEQILNSNFSGKIICVEASLGYCLKKGLVPHYVLTADPHPSRIVAFFGNPLLKTRPKDDFLSRRDPLNDPTSFNDELIELVNNYGKDIKAII